MHEPDSRALAALRAMMFAAALMPLVVTGGTVGPYVLGKGVCYRLVVEIAVLMWLGIGAPRRVSFGAGRPLVVAVAGFMGACTIATVTSVSPARSFWGTLQQDSGLFSILHDGLFFTVLVHVFTTRHHWYRFFTVCALAALPLSAMTLVESRTGDPIATIGNGAMLAHHLWVSSASAAICVILVDHRASRVAFSLLAVLHLLAAASIGVPLVLAALAGGTACVLIGASAPARRVTLAVLALVVACAAPFSDDIAALVEPSLEPLQPRMIAAGVGWRAFTERPVVGWGLEMFRHPYNLHFDPAMMTHSQQWFDRPHSKVVELAVNAGVLGLLAWLAMFAAAALVAKRAPLRIAALPVAVLVFSSLAQHAVLFDTPLSRMMLMAGFAFLVFLAQKRTDSVVGKPRPSSACFLPIALMLAWLPLQAGAHGLRAISATWPPQAEQQLREALNGSHLSAEILANMAGVLVHSEHAQDAAWDGVTTLTEAALRAALDGEPYDPHPFIWLARLHHSHARIRPDRASLVDEMHRRARALAPARPEPLYELGVVAMRRGEMLRGLNELSKALSLNPVNPRAQWLFGWAHVQAGSPRRGIPWVERAMAKGSVWVNEWEIDDLARASVAAGREDLAIRLYRDGLARRPDRARWLVALEAAGW